MRGSSNPCSNCATHYHTLKPSSQIAGHLFICSTSLISSGDLQQRGHYDASAVEFNHTLDSSLNSPLLLLVASAMDVWENYGTVLGFAPPSNKFDHLSSHSSFFDGCFPRFLAQRTSSSSAPP